MFNILLTLILSMITRVQSVCYTRCSLRSLAIAIALHCIIIISHHHHTVHIHHPHQYITQHCLYIYSNISNIHRSSKQKVKLFHQNL